MRDADPHGDADADTDQRRLRWLCRRGMKELDLKLERYLDHRWPEAPEAERRTFRRLLDAADPDIWSWLLALRPPPDPELGSLIQRLREI